jgi:hypothetical protein
LAATGGRVVRTDVVWQIAWDNVNDDPRPGDWIVDADGRKWTVLAIEWRGARSRLNVETRQWAILGPTAWIDVQQAVWDDLGSGPEIVDWQTIQTAVPAWIQPLQTTVDTAADPISSTATYEVYLGEPLTLDHNHRVVGADGTVYELMDVTRAARIDRPAVLTARKL